MLSSSEMESKNASDMPGPDVDEIKDQDEDEDESEDEEKDNDVDDDDVQREGTRTGIRHAPFGRDQNPLFALFALYST